jgi:hypothetical protein
MKVYIFIHYCIFFTQCNKVASVESSKIIDSFIFVQLYVLDYFLYINLMIYEFNDILMRVMLPRLIYINRWNYVMFKSIYIQVHFKKLLLLNYILVLSILVFCITIKLRPVSTLPPLEACTVYIQCTASAATYTISQLCT